ncbi:MAG TPA: metallophosphoesterase [Acidimicrobiia bacterium]|nr:metallophosphoesterase [Acidimicrobiia bacterium]
MATNQLPRQRWRWVPAVLLVPPLLTLGLPETLAQTTGAPDPTVVAAGDIAMCKDTGDEATAALIDSLPGTVLPLGDLAYEDGSKADFDNCYAPTWGRFKDRSRPAPGNHEYVQQDAGAYFDYWGGTAGDRTKGYYSFDVGSWHLIALNSTCSAIGGCGRGTPMEQWLKSDLAATSARCILAYWHHPRFFTPSRAPGVGKLVPTDRKMSAMWADLQAAGADVVLSGHRHVYERFARQDADGNADPTGMRSFVVGTGGGPFDFFEGAAAPNSEIRKQQTYGVLELTLHPDTYDWRFVASAGDPFTDSGSDTCGPAPAAAPAPPPPAPPPPPA